jgi:hypothetical protein
VDLNAILTGVVVPLVVGGALFVGFIWRRRGAQQESEELALSKVPSESSESSE